MSTKGIRGIVYAISPPAMHSLYRRIEDSDIAYRLARGVFWSIAGTLISRGLMLCATILVARMLGKTVYGELGMIQSTIGMLGIFAGFGLGLTATKHVAEFRRNDPERAGRIISLSALFAFGFGATLSLGLVVLAPWLSENVINAPHLTGALRVGAVMVFINAVTGAQTGALSGFEAFRAIARINLLVGLASFPILICGAYIGGLAGAVWALMINLGINWLLNYLALQSEARRQCVPLGLQGCFKEWRVLWTFSLPSVVGGMMVAPVIWTAKSMLAHQPEGYAGLGAFAVAESWRAMLFVVCGMITQASFPVLAQLYGDGDRRMFKKTLFTQFWVNAAIVCGGALIVIALSKSIMSMYGPEFSDSFFLLILVMLSCIPKQLADVVGLVNKCTGKIWWGVLLNGLWAVVYLLSVVLLIDRGALGLAWAGIISYCSHLFLSTIYMAWIFRTSPQLAGGSG